MEYRWLVEYEWLGNSIYEYLMALGIFLGLVLVLALTQWVVLKSVERFVKRTKTEFDDALTEIVKRIKPPFYAFISFYITLRYLNIEGGLEKIVRVILIAWITYQVVQSIQIFVDVYVRQRLNKTSERNVEAVVHVIHNLSSIILWTVGGLFVLSNVGVNVTSLVAGLGIGGIAIALAAQNVLGDLFSSLAIFFDKPFLPGDFITMGEYKGTVQKIGIKTTRIKSVNGEEIVVSNNELTSATLRNYGKLSERRVVFKIGLVYDTSAEKMRQIPEMVKEIIEGQEKTRFDRAHFDKFDDSSLNVEVVYYVEDKEYAAYMDVNHEILLAIKEAFEQAEIDMAYPTRVVYNKQM